MARSILSVILGIFVWGTLWVAAQSGIASAMPGSFDENGGTDSAGLLVLFLMVACVISVIAGALTARLAPRSPMRHTIVLTVAQLVIAIAVQVAFWDVLPLWYHLTFFLLVLIAHPIGGRIASTPTPSLAAA